MGSSIPGTTPSSVMNFFIQTASLVDKSSSTPRQESV
jgi:hypothetical protein